MTHGFQLRCDPADPRQNLQVNVHPEKGGPSDRWHLEGLTFAERWMDPEFSPLPREAPINTYHGEGFGRWNGESGYFAEWIFTDEGEPGVDDRIVLLRIMAPDDTVVLEVEDRTLTFGNHRSQAVPCIVNARGRGRARFARRSRSSRKPAARRRTSARRSFGRAAKRWAT